MIEDDGRITSPSDTGGKKGIAACTSLSLASRYVYALVGRDESGLRRRGTGSELIREVYPRTEFALPCFVSPIERPSWLTRALLRPSPISFDRSSIGVRHQSGPGTSQCKLFFTIACLLQWKFCLIDERSRELEGNVRFGCSFKSPWFFSVLLALLLLLESPI
ncbi:hypothetical protein VNO77_44203 [Canavalia gladiata]|uniref:Uncharacterized protein n=1 Tax=Canavalia gladiata TaxID=3824 RepID=A0AAN9JYI0_CANGL